MRLIDLSIGYNTSAPIVQSIDAELLCGSFTCLLGRNGTGKSTLLMTLAGQLAPLSGSIIMSSSISKSGSTIYNNMSSAKDAVPALVLPKSPDLQNTTVRELVCYGRLPYTGLFGRLHEADYQAADEAISRVGISHLADRKINLLSDGERQKALIARGLAQGSDTLLLDEPSAFLDYPSRRALMTLLQELSHVDKKTILLSTHDVELATQYADHLWIINDHHLIEKAPQDFSPEEL